MQAAYLFDSMIATVMKFLASSNEICIKVHIVI